MTGGFASRGSQALFGIDFSPNGMQQQEIIEPLTCSLKSYRCMGNAVAALKRLLSLQNPFKFKFSTWRGDGGGLRGGRLACNTLCVKVSSPLVK